MQREKSLVYKGKRHLPLPSGPYSVGCCDVMTSYSKYGIFVRLYYPSKESGILERHLQWPQWIPHKQYINGYAEKIGIPAYIYRKFLRMLVGDLYIPVIWEADLKPTDEKYPAIVFSHGLAAWRCTYSALCSELASRGYVVAVMEHRDHSASATIYKKQKKRRPSCCSKSTSSIHEIDSFEDFTPEFERKNFAQRRWSYQESATYSDTREWMLHQKPSKENELNFRIRQIRFRARECSEAITFLEDLNLGRFIPNVLNVNFNSKMFRDQLDLSKCFFIGHSLGGATGILALANERRFKAGILLDPWMFPFMDDQSSYYMLSQPFLCVLIKSFQTKKSLASLKKLQLASRNSDFIVLKDADHKDVSDAPFVPKISFPFFTQLGMGLEKFSALNITVELILTFLDNQIRDCQQRGISKFEVLQRRTRKRAKK